MRTLLDNYHAIKKMVLTDYPYFIEWKDESIVPVFERVYTKLVSEHANINNSYYSFNKKGLINLNYLDHYIILGYRLAHALWKNGKEDIAEAIYFSYRLRGQIDLFYKTEIGPYFIPTHALSTVMDSHAQYGGGFRIYNSVHIGPYGIIGKKASEWEHPVFGNFVTIFSHSRIFGKTIIGNNVIISSGTTLINAKIPDNCVVMGTSPNLYFLPLSNSNEIILIRRSN